MGTSIEGLVYLVGDDVDTDQIIPARYLCRDLGDSSTIGILASHALSGLPSESYGIRFVQPPAVRSAFNIVVAGHNFGCGSSREQAVLALAAAGARAIVARSFARLFLRNCVATGALYPFEFMNPGPQVCSTGDRAQIDVAKSCMAVAGRSSPVALRLGAEQAAVIESGGLFAYARRMGWIQPKVVSGHIASRGAQA